MTAVQAHRYADALDAFRTLSAQYPEEQELLERARVYEAVCERHLARASAEPRNLEERVYAATLALNQGDVDTALGHLEAVVAADGTHDGALYMLGVGHALRNDSRLALSYLRRAIAANPSNRAAALHDEQLASLLRDDAIRAALEPDPGLSPGSR